MKPNIFLAACLASLLVFALAKPISVVSALPTLLPWSVESFNISGHNNTVPTDASPAVGSNQLDKTTGIKDYESVLERVQDVLFSLFWEEENPQGQDIFQEMAREDSSPVVYDALKPAVDELVATFHDPKNHNWLQKRVNDEILARLERVEQILEDYVEDDDLPFDKSHNSTALAPSEAHIPAVSSKTTSNAKKDFATWRSILPYWVSHEQPAVNNTAASEKITTPSTNSNSPMAIVMKREPSDPTGIKPALINLFSQTLGGMLGRKRDATGNDAGVHVDVTTQTDADIVAEEGVLRGLHSIVEALRVAIAASVVNVTNTAQHRTTPTGNVHAVRALALAIYERAEDNNTSKDKDKDKKKEAKADDGMTEEEEKAEGAKEEKAAKEADGERSEGYLLGEDTETLHTFPMNHWKNIQWPKRQAGESKARPFKWFLRYYQDEATYGYQLKMFRHWRGTSRPVRRKKARKVLKVVTRWVHQDTYTIKSRAFLMTTDINSTNRLYCPEKTRRDLRYASRILGKPSFEKMFEEHLMYTSNKEPLREEARYEMLEIAAFFRSYKTVWHISRRPLFTDERDSDRGMVIAETVRLLNAHDWDTLLQPTEDGYGGFD
ncbi:hypothetical protein PVAG01_04847 [Phlyctema vagabunda]|uniref:Uncharacterized protein n=1 Tax=Phlyctema vagabunda TaxID=108571 RepID=A0ABR4PIH6_9HELO